MPLWSSFASPLAHVSSFFLLAIVAKRTFGTHPILVHVAVASQREVTKRRELIMEVKYTKVTKGSDFPRIILNFYPFLSDLFKTIRDVSRVENNRGVLQVCKEPK